MDYNMIMIFFKDYGWKMTLLALCGVFILGFLKSTGMFNKLKDNLKKYVYFSISCVLSIIACTIFIVVEGNFDWINWLVLSGSIILFTLAFYGVYENLGIRAMFKAFLFTPVKNLLAKLVEAVITNTLTEEVIVEHLGDFTGDVIDKISTDAKMLAIKNRKEKAELEAQEALKKKEKAEAKLAKETKITK